jgi:PAS domain S-box-containing protein
MNRIRDFFFSGGHTSSGRNPDTVENFVLLSQLLYFILSGAIFYVLLQITRFPQTGYVMGLMALFTAAYIVIFVFSSLLGNKAGVYLLYFPLITSTLVVYSFYDKEKIVMTTALSFIFLGLLDFTDHRLWLLPLSPDAQHAFYAANFILSIGMIGFCIIYLITVLYHTQTRLDESEANLSSILSSLNEVVWAATLPERDIIYINAASERVFAFPHKHCYENKKYWTQILLPADRVEYESFEAEVYKKGSDEIEYRVVRKNGEMRWLKDRCKIIRDEEGIPVRLEGITSDITERKLADDKIKQQNEQLRGILESTQSSIFALDLEYNYLTFNSKHKKNLRSAYGVEMAKGANITDENHFGQDTEKVMAHLNRAAQGEQFLVIEEMGNADCRRTWYETIYNPIQDDYGHVTGIAVFSRDITERKRAENELVRTNFELDTFVYRASHDMRAPLRSVLGLVNLSRMETDEDQKAEYLKLIEKSVDKLDTFFSDLLSFSRNSRLEILKEPGDFKKSIKNVWNDLQYLENAPSIVLLKDIHMEEEFYSDSSRIEIILQNLFSNAIKYQNLNADAYVRISIHATREQAQIVVEDNGRGIEEQYLDKIFDMFFRATLGTHGSGLGLYITKQVIEKLGGDIHVQSEIGKGTGFTVTLPNFISSTVPAEVMSEL